MRMDRKFSLTLLTLALAGSLCACTGNTTEATPTPDNSPMATPENRSGIVGYGYNGYDTTNNGTWDATNGGMWDADDITRGAVNDVEKATRGAVNDVGDAARNAVNDVRRGMNDMTWDAEWSNGNVW